MSANGDVHVSGEERSAGGVRASELDAILRRVAAHEAAVRLTPIGRFLKVVGRTESFGAVYRRVGPKVDRWLERRFKGQVAARVYGIPALVLVTTGAKTGLRRASPLLYVRDGRDFLIVGTNFGQLHHPAWTNNLLAEPRAAVEIGGESVPVVATLLDEGEFSASWPRFVATYPGYAGYLERCERSPRMFRLRPSASDSPSSEAGS